jgi:lactoylglutathione lyase
MFLRNFLSVAVALTLASPISACNPPVTRDLDPNASYPRNLPGPDVYPDLETVGYKINHFSLFTNNYTGMMDFYTRVLGMRVIFNFEASAKYNITYLGHSHGGKNNTGWQPTAELNRQKNNIEGLLELIHRADLPEPVVPSTEKLSTFAHFGLVVPDMEAAQRRLEANGANILKRVGDVPTKSYPILSVYGALNMTTEDSDELMVALGVVGAKYFLLVTDPDGNFIEIQPEDLPQL